MKGLWVLAMFLPMACSTSGSSPCGDGEELRADGTSACLYRETLIEEGFQCPPDASFRTDLEDGAVVCSNEQPLPPDVMGELEAQGYRAPTNGTAWTVDDTPTGPGGASTPPRDTSDDPRVMGTLIERDDFQPLDGVRVCLLDAEPEVCTTTDARGQFVLRVAPNSEYALTAEREGYHPRILPMAPMGPPSAPFLSSDIVVRGWGLRTVEAEAALLATADIVQSRTRGLVSIDVDAPGAVATLEPGDEEGWYLDGGALVRSSTGTPLPNGLVHFPDLAPGDRTASITAPNLRCEASGWVAAANNVIRVPVRAGFITNPLGVQCR